MPDDNRSEIRAAVDESPVARTAAPSRVRPAPPPVRARRAGAAPVLALRPAGPSPEAQAAAPPALDALLHAAGRGDRAAFAALHDRVADGVYGLARRVLRDPALAHEVARDSLLAVWRTAPRFDPDAGSAGAWVMAITHRRAVERLRELPDTHGEEPPPRHHEVPDHGAYAIESRLDRQRVREALEDLTASQREAIELAYYGGYTCREVAELLGAPATSIRRRLRDALVHLRDGRLGVSA